MCYLYSKMLFLESINFWRDNCEYKNEEVGWVFY